MKEDRFLTGILIVIALLVVVSLAVFALKKDGVSYQSEDAPQGIVHNYILALQRGEYQKAYGYLAEKENKPSFDAFQRDIIANQSGTRDTGIQINDVIDLGDTVQVELTVIDHAGGPFLSEYRYSETAMLIWENGEWKLLQMPYFYWSYDWYREKE